MLSGRKSGVWGGGPFEGGETPVALYDTVLFMLSFCLLSGRGGGYFDSALPCYDFLVIFWVNVSVELINETPKMKYAFKASQRHKIDSKLQQHNFSGSTPGGNPRYPGGFFFSIFPGGETPCECFQAENVVCVWGNRSGGGNPGCYGSIWQAIFFFLWTM